MFGWSVKYGWVIQYFPFSNITMHGICEEDLKIINFWVVTGKVHQVLKFSLHELKGVLFVDSAVFQVNLLTKQREN